MSNTSSHCSNVGLPAVSRMVSAVQNVTHILLCLYRTCCWNSHRERDTFIFSCHEMQVQPIVTCRGLSNTGLKMTSHNVLLYTEALLTVAMWSGQKWEEEEEQSERLHHVEFHFHQVMERAATRIKFPCFKSRMQRVNCGSNKMWR